MIHMLQEMNYAQIEKVEPSATKMVAMNLHFCLGCAELIVFGTVWLSRFYEPWNGSLDEETTQASEAVRVAQQR